MGEAVEFKGFNCRLHGAENVGEMPVFRNGVTSTSCWELAPEELVEIIRTGRVYVAVMFGKTQPPVYVGSETAVRAMTADYGVWKR